MKIAHMSDLHFSPGNLEESSACFGFAVKDAIARNVSAAVISGDSTDHMLQANSPALIALARQVQQLAEHCPVLMLQGTFSHEPIGLLQIMGLIGAKYPIYVADKIGMVGLKNKQWVEFDPVGVEASSYDAVFSCIPTISKADLAITVGAENAAVEMGNHLAVLLAAHGQINQKLRALGIPTVLVSHGTVDGSETEHGVPMAGLDHEFSVGALFSAGADATMIGHIHKHQVWERDYQSVRQVIAYPGSIGRFHYGEIGKKHYLSWNVLPGNATFEAVVTPSRQMIDLEFIGAPNLDEIAAVAAECAGAFVRIRYQVDEEYANTIDRASLKAMLPDAREVKIEGKILPIQREKRCAGISLLKSSTERFTRWAELTSSSMEGISDRIAMAESMSADDIVKQILVKDEPPKAVPQSQGNAVPELENEEETFFLF